MAYTKAVNRMLTPNPPPLLALADGALILRSLALCVVLYQFRLIAADLADTAVFSAAVFSAFASAAALSLPRFMRPGGGRTAPFAAVVSIALIPWAARAFIALPRLLIPDGTDSVAVGLDSLLLNLDRNNFVSLLPFYYAAATSWFSIRSRRLLRASVVADAALLLVVFSIARTADIAMYRWPVVMIALFAGIVFMQALSLLFSLPPETRLRKNETIPAVAVILALIAIGGWLFLKPLQERATEKGGGLLEPKLFSFDFSQVLRLDTEISMNDDLILIVKKDNDNMYSSGWQDGSYPLEHILLRRSVMSGYSRKQGFYRVEEIDERTHPQRLPQSRSRVYGKETAALSDAGESLLSAVGEPPPFPFDDMADDLWDDLPLIADELSLTAEELILMAEDGVFSADGESPLASAEPPFKAARRVYQEYFLVNFDASAFVGMKEPLEVIPYENWDASSFSSAYAVQSLVSDASTTALARAVPAGQWPTPDELGLSEREFRIYTDYGGDQRLKAFAEEITRGVERYGDKVRMINNRLRYGEYRYSLKPGIAPDGDQLAWFLFQSKKGYCSYYAFAMTLMLRSLGIPARVAAGFFIDPSTNTFDYYPVRSDMAHAWVEVLFPEYGWIEYDPTTETLAEDEEFFFSAGVDPNLFERLMREILENRSHLRAKEGQDAETTTANARSLAQSAVAIIRSFGPLVLLAAIVIAFVLIRCGFFFAAALCTGGRRKAIRLWKHSQMRLRLAGLGRPPSLPESEWAAQTETRVAGTYALYQGAAAARFAPEYAAGDLDSMRAAYRAFSVAYRAAVPPGRRFLAWILPPLALALGPAPRLKASALSMILLIAMLASSGVEAQNAGDYSPADADALYNDAVEAEYIEFWERAIELYREGGAQYPDDPRFPWALGNLYYSRSLYGLAWDEYRKADLISPFDPSILMRLANTAGYLNRDHVSVRYLEQLLAIEPDNKEAIGYLGWMYYKVHRLKEGERLLTAAIERFGDDADLSMTLGTVYADMYHYDDGKFWYHQAILLGEAMRDRVFTAVAHYNLSILEARFYHYDLSLDEANASIDSQKRASGLLARGEIYLRRLEMQKARLDYESAYEIDTSALAKTSLAQIYQVSGRLEEARLYAEDCLKRGDNSWMLNYGIDPDRYKRDIHEILYKSYAGLAKTERFLTWGSVGEQFRSFFRTISYRFKAAVHEQLYHKYSLAAADAYGDINTSGINAVNDGEVPALNAFIQYYNAFEKYPDRAIGYLKQVRDVESAIIPASKPAYDLEEGKLLKNKDLVADALGAFDPAWEREMIAQCYEELAGTRFGRAQARREAGQAAAGELFALNRGALRQAGISLPLEINIRFNIENSGATARRSERAMMRTLAKAGFTPADGSRFRLEMSVNGSLASGYTASCELIDAAGGEKPLRHVIPLRSLSAADIRDCVRALGNAVFKAE